MNESIRIVEVGARDGLQNEKSVITFQQRYKFLTRLMATGIKAIEVGSCVSAKWVPQMANSDELYAQLPKQDDISLSLLTPNLKGFEAALQVKCQEIAVFTAASESFTQKILIVRFRRALNAFKILCNRPNSIIFGCVVMYRVWWTALMRVQFPPRKLQKLQRLYMTWAVMKYR